MQHIVVVEDEPLIRTEISILLANAGYRVSTISNFTNTTQQVLDAAGELIILDLNLPSENGFQICKNLKAQAAQPILVLTSRDGLDDEIKALQLGADEYLTKPFRKERLLARIENLFKRYEGRKNLLEKYHFLLDRNTYTLYINGNSFLMPPNQGKLLEVFMSATNGVVTKTELCLKLWNTTEFIGENSLQVNITRLKKFIHEASIPLEINSVRGIGYQLVEVSHDVR